MQIIADSSKIRGISDFKWKDSTNKFHTPSSMETRHLFYTLRMIWNHTMPEEAKLKPYKKYYFGSFYTEKYLLEAIIHIYSELCTRKDISLKWEAELQKMYLYINTNSITIDKLKAGS